MKEQTKNTEAQINEEEIGKIPEKEFRIMIVKIIKNLWTNLRRAETKRKKEFNLEALEKETSNTAS